MDGEVFFRRAAIGGFNRDDVLNYISSVTSDSNELKTARESAKKSADEAAALKAELDLKNSEINSLKEKIKSLESELAKSDDLRRKADELESKNFEAKTTADNLMHESIAYAERYVESASLMARNIRSDTVQKIKDADLKVSEMLKKIDGLADNAEAFENLLLMFKAEFHEITDILENENVGTENKT